MRPSLTWPACGHYLAPEDMQPGCGCQTASDCDRSCETCPECRGVQSLEQVIEEAHDDSGNQCDCLNCEVSRIEDSLPARGDQKPKC